jgi:uncharacterized membrane protein
MNSYTDDPTSSNRLRLALPLSVILNLFLLAVIAGHFLRHEFHRAGPAAAASPLVRLARVESELDPRDAARFEAAIGRGGVGLAAAAQRMAASRRALLRQLVAEPFDARGARQALDTWRISWNAFMTQLSGPLIDALSSISPAGRRLLVKDRQERLKRERCVSGPLC